MNFNFFLFGSFAKQICICYAATLSEAETFQGQITQWSSIANKRSNRCHAPSGAVKMIVNKTKKDESRWYKQKESSRFNYSSMRNNLKLWDGNQERVISISLNLSKSYNYCVTLAYRWHICQDKFLFFVPQCIVLRCSNDIWRKLFNGSSSQPVIGCQR